MRRIRVAAAAAASLALLVAACSKKADATPPVATPTLAMSRTDAPIGSPVDLTYSFTVSPSAPPITDDYTVFVHFLDKDGELMWTDDHAPTPPTRDWKPGATIKYTRTLFVPKFPYLGEATVELGLYSTKTGQRLPLVGKDQGMRSYRVATFEMQPQPESTFVVFKDGWHETEMGPPGSGVEWQWSSKASTLAFRNPKRDATLFLDCDEPVTVLGRPQHVEVRVGSTTVDSFDLQPAQHELRRVMFQAGQLGDDDTVNATIVVDPAFVPSTMPQLKSTDTRELGIRVFKAYLQPK